MQFENNIRDIIQTRYSCRTFSAKRIDHIARNRLINICQSIHRGLFGENIELFFIESAGNGIRSTLSGGFEYIRNTGSFIAGKIQNSQFAYESFGYTVEQIVLKATDLGLGTCWIGYFNPEFFHEVRISSDEIFPAIIILGYPEETSSFNNIFKRKFGLVRTNRMKWNQLFFYKDFNEPLTEDRAGRFCDSLEMLRLAPSSGNTQPWRIIKDPGVNNFHFYKKIISYHYELKKLHNIDIGIAMCHFDLAAKNTGLNGKWITAKPDLDTPADTDYIISWNEIKINE